MYFGDSGCCHVPKALDLDLVDRSTERVRNNAVFLATAPSGNAVFRCNNTVFPRKIEPSEVNII